MAYVKTNWQNGVTPVNADNMNKIEGGIENALAKPDAVLSSNELVGVGTNGEQIRVQLGGGLVLEGTGSPYTLKASGGGGGGFTPRLLYATESITNTGGGYTKTKEEMRFKLHAGACSDWHFTANVKCYLMYSTDGSPSAGYKFLNSGESFGINGIFTGATIYIYPLEDYNTEKREIGTFNGIPD